MEQNKDEDRWLDTNCWKNKSALYRYFAMLNLCFLGFGAFLVYDAVGAFQESIMSTLNLNAQQYSYLFALGSWSSTCFCFFGGYLIDKLFGIKVGALIYVSIVVFGHFTFTMGILFNQFWCALLGRFLLGAGIEFTFICLLYYTFIYFKGKELSLVQCLTFSISRLGSSAIFLMAYPLLDFVRQRHSGGRDVGIAILLVSVFIIGSLLSTIILFFMDPKKKNDHRDHKEKQSKDIRLLDVLHFGVPFWLAVILNCAHCNNIYITMPYAQGFFMTVHGYTADEANSVSSFCSFVGAPSALVFGIMVDKTGYEASVVIIGLAMACISHGLLAFTSMSPYFSMFLLALSFNLTSAALFPLVTYTVPEKKLGTAYGTMQTAVNCCYTLVVMLAGTFVDQYGYRALEFFVFCNVLVGLISAKILWFLNNQRHGNLNWTAKKRRLNNLKELEPKEEEESLKQHCEVLNSTSIT